VLSVTALAVDLHVDGAPVGPVHKQVNVNLEAPPADLDRSLAVAPVVDNDPNDIYSDLALNIFNEPGECYEFEEEVSDEGEEVRSGPWICFCSQLLIRVCYYC
jgi:hypothetical protein